jgi:2-keto-4-pentenoate hydratase
VFEAIAQRLLDADANAATIEPISTTVVGVDTSAAYAVLDHIAARRVADHRVVVDRGVGANVIR